MAPLGSTGLKQIANKLVIYLATALPTLALVYNTHEALVTKTWDRLKSAISMQDFKITIHGLQRKTVIMEVVRNFYSSFVWKKYAFFFINMYYSVYICNSISVWIVHRTIF